MPAIRTLIGLSMAGTTIVVSVVAGTAGPASAEVTDCATQKFCSWVDGGFAGRMWSADGNDSYVDAPSFIHDNGSSWYNHNATRRECVLDHVGGRQVTLDRLVAGVRRGAVPAGTNDRIDAVGWC